MDTPGSEIDPVSPEDTAWMTGPPPRRHRLAPHSTTGNLLDLDPSYDILDRLTFPERMLSFVCLMGLTERARETYLDRVGRESSQRGVGWSAYIDGSLGPVRELSPELAITIKSKRVQSVGEVHEYVTIPAEIGRWGLRELERLAGLDSPWQRFVGHTRSLTSRMSGRSYQPDTGSFHVRIGDQVQHVLVLIFRFRDRDRYVLRFGEIRTAEQMEHPGPEGRG